MRLDLTHWGRVTHICVGNLTIIGTDNGLSPGRRQAIIWTNAGILLIGPLGTNFNEISIGIQTFSFKKIHFKMSSAKWRPFCLGLNVLRRSSLCHRWLSRLSLMMTWVSKIRLINCLDVLHFVHDFHNPLSINSNNDKSSNTRLPYTNDNQMRNGKQSGLL